MTSFFHLASLCCIPPENEAARKRERQVFREALLERAKYEYTNGYHRPPANGRPPPQPEE